MLTYIVLFCAGLIVGWWFFPAPAWAVSARNWVYEKFGWE